MKENYGLDSLEEPEEDEEIYEDRYLDSVKSHYVHTVMPMSFFIKNSIIPAIVIMTATLSTYFMLNDKIGLMSISVLFALLTVVSFTYCGKLFKSHGNNYNITIFILVIAGIIAMSLFFMGFNIVVKMLIFNL